MNKQIFNSHSLKEPNENVNEDLEISDLAINLSFLTTNLDSTFINKKNSQNDIDREETLSKNEFENNNFLKLCDSHDKFEFSNSTNKDFIIEEFNSNNDYIGHKLKNEKIINLNHLKISKSMPGYYSILYNLIKGNIYFLITRYCTSKQLQKGLHFWNQDIIIKIFKEIYPSLPRLLIHPYANYFCQKLYKYLTKNERVAFIFQIQPFLFEISCNNFGNYTLQFIIENFQSEEEIKFFLIPLFNPEILSATVNNVIGLNVIEKLVKFLNQKYIDFIYEFVLSNFNALSSNKVTINLVKKIIIFVKFLPTKLKIVKIVLSNFNYLIYDAIANNSIQCILEVNKLINNFIFINNI